MKSRRRAWLLFLLLAAQSIPSTAIADPPVTFKDTIEFRQKFGAIKKGMTEAQVRSSLGPPVQIESGVWSYFEKRAPRAGEQLMIYQVTFLKGSVAETRLVPGPDATGPAQ